MQKSIHISAPGITTSNSSAFRKSIFCALLMFFSLVTLPSCTKTDSKKASIASPEANLNLEKEIYESELPVVIDFYADWCHPCKILAPRLEEVMKDYDSQLKLVKVNVDKSPALAEKYKIESIPRIQFYSAKCKDGKYFEGVRSKEKIKAFLEECLSECK